jgi:hypothetical protein
MKFIRITKDKYGFKITKKIIKKKLIFKVNLKKKFKKYTIKNIVMFKVKIDLEKKLIISIIYIN